MGETEMIGFCVMGWIEYVAMKNLYHKGHEERHKDVYFIRTRRLNKPRMPVTGLEGWHFYQSNRIVHIINVK